MRDISHDFSEKVVKVSSLYSAHTYQEQDEANWQGISRESSKGEVTTLSSKLLKGAQV